MHHFFVLIGFHLLNAEAQEFYEWKKTYQSPLYSYSITIPKTFKKIHSKRKNIDMKFQDDYGATILVNVTQRLPEEYSITAHDFSKEMLEQMYRQASPNIIISRAEKVYVGGQMAFLIEYSGGVSSKLKAMECYIYYSDKVFLITGTAGKIRFDNYKQLFEDALMSISYK